MIMKTVWSNKIDKILKIGQPLDSIGVHNWALTREQALNVLSQFLVSEISVLGGDVYESIDGIIQSNYDSWYCELLPGESNGDFLKRSIEDAKLYIEGYKIKVPNMIFFGFVPNV